MLRTAFLAIGVTVLFVAPSASAQTGRDTLPSTPRLGINGSWQVVGRDGSGNTFYERRTQDRNGNIVVQRARRDSRGNMSIISTNTAAGTETPPTVDFGTNKPGTIPLAAQDIPASSVMPPGYLQAMPAVDRVLSDMKVADSVETRARQYVAVSDLYHILVDLTLDHLYVRTSDNQVRSGLTPEESRLDRGYLDAQNRLNSGSAGVPGLRALINRYSAKSAPFHRELLDRYFSPAWKAAFLRLDAQFLGKETPAMVQAEQRAEQRAPYLAGRSKSRLDGTYAFAGAYGFGKGSLTFKSNGKVTVFSEDTGTETELHYTVDGNKVRLTNPQAPGVTQIMTLLDDGSIEGAFGAKFIKQE
jgi:hypothetical protein